MKPNLSIQESAFLWMLKNSSDLIILLHSDGQLIDISESAASLYNLSPKFITDKNYFSQLQSIGLEVPFNQNDLTSITADKQIIQKEETFKLDKKTYTIHWLASSLYCNQKNQTLCILYGKDISQQRHAEQQERNTKLNLEHIVSCMPGNIYWMDENSIYLGCNQNTADLINLQSPDEVVGKTYENFITIGKWEERATASFRNDDLEVITTGKPKLNVEEPPLIHPKTGKTIYYLTSRVPIKDDKNKIIGVVGVSVDITERKIMEQELYKAKAAVERANYENLQLLEKLNQEVLGKSAKNHENIEEYAYAIRHHLLSVISAMPWNIYWMDKNLNYLGCNQNAAELIGLNSPSEVVGKTYEDFIQIGNWNKEAGESFKNDDLEVIATGKAKLNVEEPPLKGPDGKTRYFLTSRVPLRDKNNDITGVVGISVDITELKKTQEKLKQAEIRNESMMSLSASIAHELRTPLSSIQAATNVGKHYFPFLVEGYRAAKEHKLQIEPIRPQYLQSLDAIFDSIESETRYSNAIIDMILMNVRQATIPKSDFQTYSINECIKEAMERYPFKRDQQSCVKWNIHQNFFFEGDKTLLVHLLFNLMKNSLYYIQAANKGTIEIWTEIKNANSFLYFKDTGQGIPPEVLPNIFEKFYTTTRHGTGLGLSYCKMIMTEFGGTINCRSQYGEYTQFEMIFPRVNQALNQ